MREPAAQPDAGWKPVDLSREEQRSLTHGEFWIPEAERNVYRHALESLNRAGVPFVVSGLYAIYEYTGIYRKTKDLDLFFEPRHLIAGARALKDQGFSVHLEDPHWLAKAFRDERQIDLIYGMGNGLAAIDEDWYRYSRAGILAATQVRVAPPEELLFHRLYVSERHRHDMADVLHLILCRGDELVWERVIERLGDHFRLLLAQVHLFDFAYPGYASRVPAWVRESLALRALSNEGNPADPRVCQGTLISRFSFNIDVNEWGFHDPRYHATEAMRALPEFTAIRESDVWTD
jgi:hypothetical protein